MLPPIAALDALHVTPSDATSGCYTLATLTHLAQSLAHLALADGGLLLVSDQAPARPWGDLLELAAGSPIRVAEVPPPTHAQGALLVGVGARIGFILAAEPTEVPAPEDNAQLFDVIWTMAPGTVRLTAARLAPGLPPDDARALATLQAPDTADGEALAAAALAYASRHHSALAVASRAMGDRLRNHEDQTRMIIHDMRAPLHTMQMSVRAMLRQAAAGGLPTELLEVARDSISYLLNLTETLLESARLESGQLSPSRKPVRLATLIQSVCEPLELANQGDQPIISRSVPDDLPVLHLDRGLIERVLTNLVTNAMKYTPPGGQIRVSAAQRGNAVEIVVADNGRGIAPEAQERIFDRFYQVSANDRANGTGLGLYFCRLAVEAHDGTISVASALGKGSAFTVRLPIG